MYNLQIPFVVVTPGPEPITRSAKLTMIESACERKFHPDDFKNIDRKGTGVVLSYNGKNHYCPTVIISQKDFVTWQLQCVGHMASATITFINDIDQNNCTPQQKSLLLKMDSILTESVRSFGGAAAPTTATGTRVPRDVMFSQVPGSVSQPGSSTQSHAGVHDLPKKKGEKIITAIFVSTSLAGKKILTIILVINTKLANFISAM